MRLSASTAVVGIAGALAMFAWLHPIAPPPPPPPAPGLLTLVLFDAALVGLVPLVCVMPGIGIGLVGFDALVGALGTVALSVWLRTRAPSAVPPSLSTEKTLLLAAAALFVCVPVVAALTRAAGPKRARRFTPTEVAGRACDCTVDAFKKRKVPADIDFVFIGSGIGSLFAAALLAKAGYRVVVLEQHYVTGGCTHSFEDHGYEFDTGLHYVGRVEKYKQLLDLVSARGKEVEWAKMGSPEDGFGYDTVKLGKEAPHTYRAGERAFVDDLAARFSAERAGIEAYVALCKQVNRSADMYFFGKLFTPLLQKLVNALLCKRYFEYASRTAQEVVHSAVSDPRLRSLLLCQFGNYGLAPERSSFLIQAGITAHYLGGAYYPVGGPQEISRAIIPTIEAAGGRVLVRAAVSQILIEGGRAVGVAMRDGGEVRVRHGGAVVTGAGAVITQSLVPPAQRARLGYAPMLRAVRPSISHVYAFVGLEGTTEELGLSSANLWVLPTTEDGQHRFRGVGVDPVEGLLEEGLEASAGAREMLPPQLAEPWEGVGEDEEVDDMLMFMSSPSARDPSSAGRHPGKSTVCIITTAYADTFAPFYDLEAGGAKGGNQSLKRAIPAYDALKSSLQEKLLRGLYRHFPKCRGKVRFADVATPLTNKYYLGRADSYGLEHTPAHYNGALTAMRPQTQIPGLFATGQDIGTVGIVGALNGGILTAHACLGYGALDLVLAKRNLIEDLMAVEPKKRKAKSKMPKKH